jgi:ribosomal protein S18 acetylase RimI-like enzyme
MNATVAIRRATVDDRAFVRDLGRRVSNTSVSSLRPGMPELVAEAFEGLVTFLLTRDHAIFLAVEHDVPLGFAMMVFDLPEEVTLSRQAFLAYMAVEPVAWNRGIGAALLEACETLARQRGYPHISLMVTEENDAARRLYESAGFTTERRTMTKAL